MDQTKDPHALGSFAIGAGKKKGGCRCNSPTKAEEPKKKAHSPWVAHVKAYAAKHGVSYKDALKGASASYKR